jgi:hypothetical protein
MHLYVCVLCVRLTFLCAARSTSSSPPPGGEGSRCPGSTAATRKQKIPKSVPQHFAVVKVTIENTFENLCLIRLRQALHPHLAYSNDVVPRRRIPRNVLLSQVVTRNFLLVVLGLLSRLEAGTN